MTQPNTIIENEAAYHAALRLARGCYQEDIIEDAKKVGDANRSLATAMSAREKSLNLILYAVCVTETLNKSL